MCVTFVIRPKAFVVAFQKRKCSKINMTLADALFLDLLRIVLIGIGNKICPFFPYDHMFIVSFKLDWHRATIFDILFLSMVYT